MNNKSNFPYLHGFSKTEQDRLREQASFSEQAIYRDIDFSDASHILEVGCGVGAQTEILLRRFPKLELTGIDLSDNQLESAKDSLSKSPYTKDRYELLKMNAQKLDFDSNKFDGAFICWLLEHVPNPTNVLSEVRRVLRPGSTVYITEVLNSSFFLDPYSPNVWKYWMAFNDYQFENSGDPFIGAKLGNLLLSLGFEEVETKTKTWHFDNRHPDKRKRTIEYWSDLLMSASDQLIKDSVIDEKTVQCAKEELSNVANDPNAVFYYSFIQAQAKVY